jgi:flagellar biogenesis protein FliO
LFFPLIMVLGFFLKIILALLFVIFSIWLLGKFIIFVWERIFKTK